MATRSSSGYVRSPGASSSGPTGCSTRSSIASSRLGYVTTEWRTPPEGRRRKYYAITDEGRAALADQQQQWVTVTRALNDVWPGSGGVLTALGEA